MVLAEQTNRSQYLATMEPEETQTEDALFYNLNTTRTPKPIDYPQDNTTTPNTAVAKLNGSDPDKRIAPSIILKVMAGDTIQAAVRAYHKAETNPKKKASVPAEQMLAGLLRTLVAPQSQALSTHSAQVASGGQTTGRGLTANDLRSLRQKDPNNKEINKPKAYLNYVFFDKQLNFVEEGSGVKQVDGEAGELETLSSGKAVAKENGYVYVFTSNESPQPVFFDNLGVTHITGPVLEETHYYPFGLTMAGISTMAPLKLEAKRKFNGIEFNHKEFSDGSGLELYTARFRDYDPQVGRWNQIDPRPNMNFSPYAGMGDNPMFFRDFLGDTTTLPGGNPLHHSLYIYDPDGPSSEQLFNGMQLQQRQNEYWNNLMNGLSLANKDQKVGRQKTKKSHPPINKTVGNMSLSEGLTDVNTTLNRINRIAGGIEIGTKYLNKMISMEVFGKIGKFGRVGNLTGVASIFVNGIRYTYGDISGMDYGYSSYITTLAIGSSVALGPEAGILVEGAGYVIPIVYNGVNTALEQPSWGITNRENNFQNYAAGSIITGY